MNPSIQKALARLGMLEQFASGMRDIANQPLAQVQAWFAEFRARVKAQYLLMAHAAHPDHGGTTELMQEINAAWGQVKHLKIVQRQPQRPRIRVIRVSMWSDTSTVTATTSTSTGGYYW